jgi:hypothetical protein
MRIPKLYILYLCLYSQFITLVQKNHRNVCLHDETYETLKQMGALTESFDDVINRLIKAASGSSSFQGPESQKAVGRFNPEAEGR